VFGTQGFHLVQFLCKGLFEVLRVERSPANNTAHEIHGRHFVPFSLEKTFKFHGVFGTDSPAIATAGAKAHVVQELSLVSLVQIVEGAGGAILYARETPIAPLVYAKKTRHLLLTPIAF
jgi:hypothetical protein